MYFFCFNIIVIIYFFSVTSSEKVDKEKRYCDFNIISLPYPGCEFFKEFRSKNYSAKGLVFDWTQTHVDADIDVPDDSTANNLKISWSDYKVSLHFCTSEIFA